jgi:hypothetical protein
LDRERWRNKQINKGREKMNKIKKYWTSKTPNAIYYQSINQSIKTQTLSLSFFLLPLLDVCRSFPSPLLSVSFHFPASH